MCHRLSVRFPGRGIRLPGCREQVVRACTALVAVFLIPSSSSRIYDDEITEARRKEALREEILRAKPTVRDVRERYREMDERLARIEKYVTSSRYELDEEFRRL